MGDHEFEKYLGDDGDSHEEEGGFNGFCHRRLMLETIQQKMNFISNLYGITANICSEMRKDATKQPDIGEKLVSTKSYEKMLGTLYKLSESGKDTLDQIDFFFASLISDLETDDPKKS